MGQTTVLSPALPVNLRSAVEIRQATPEDAAVIETLYRQLVSNPAVTVRADRIAQVGADANTALLVATVHQKVVGTVLVSLCLDVMFNDQPFAVIENIVVDAQHRSLGLGSALLRQVELLCLARQCSKIMLLSSATREQAHRCFERAGFQGNAKRGFVKYRRAFETQ